MSDVAIKRVEDCDSPNGGGFCRVRAGLLAIGGTPGQPYSPPAFTQEGAQLPG